MHQTRRQIACHLVAELQSLHRQPASRRS
jgi:hypothetical protein